MDAILKDIIAQWGLLGVLMVGSFLLIRALFNMYTKKDADNTEQFTKVISGLNTSAVAMDKMADSHDLLLRSVADGTNATRADIQKLTAAVDGLSRNIELYRQVALLNGQNNNAGRV